MKHTNRTIRLLILLVAAWPGAVGATTYYVNSGQSIQAAIDGASNGDQIEVRPATYTEGINFLGKAIRLYSRDGAATTIISGTGKYHTVQCVLGEGADTILEGFTIRNGNANGTGTNSQGGGMLISGSPTVFRCTFTANAGRDGAGMYVASGSPAVSNCTFTSNTSTNCGGGLFIGSSGTVVTECTFTSNTATNAGGGIYNNWSGATVTRCTFTSNIATENGGGFYNEGGSPILTGCTFTGNGAKYGGAMYNVWNSAAPVVTHCVFLNNSGSIDGGAVLNQAAAVPTFINCLFRGNNKYAFANHGYNGASMPTLTNCILWGDTPGEIYNMEGGSAVITYSDIQGGHAGEGNINADPLFINAAGGDFRFISSGSPCVDSGNNSVVTQTTDLAGNPRITDGDWDGIAVVDMGVYELQSKDIHNITADTWYELIQTAINNSVNGDQIEVGPGTYREAINFSNKAVRLFSRDGRDITIIDAEGLSAPVVTCVSGEGAGTVLEGFTLTRGVGRVSGSYRYGGGMYNGASSPTVTDCRFAYNTVTGDGGGMYNTNSSPKISNCDFTYNSAAFAGGGMDNRSASVPTVSNCTFSHNTAVNGGGGMENNASAAAVTGCTFTENSAKQGGGVYNTSCNPVITGCNFISNTVTDDGGGLYNTASHPKISLCAFLTNQAGKFGGGLCNVNSDPTLKNCLFIENSATTLGGGGVGNQTGSDPTLINCVLIGNSSSAFNGGAIANHGSGTASKPTLINCTLTRNSAVTGGAIFSRESSVATVTNCILWNDSPGEIANLTSGSATVSYSDIQGGYAGTKNINADPNFVDGTNPDLFLADLRLNAGSPCIDAGNTEVIPSGVLVDMNTSPRGVDDPSTPDTGIGALGVFIDMGAYEFQPCSIEGDINCDGKVDLRDLSRFSSHWLEGV
jgi:hypothetical protein